MDEAPRERGLDGIAECGRMGGAAHADRPPRRSTQTDRALPSGPMGAGAAQERVAACRDDERAGARGVPRLLSAATWDSVVAHLGDEATGVLIVEETVFLKKGRKSCGVARQYSPKMPVF